MCSGVSHLTFLSTRVLICKSELTIALLAYSCCEVVSVFLMEWGGSRNSSIFSGIWRFTDCPVHRLKFMSLGKPHVAAGSGAVLFFLAECTKQSSAVIISSLVTDGTSRFSVLNRIHYSNVSRADRKGQE